MPIAGSAQSTFPDHSYLAISPSPESPILYRIATVMDKSIFINTDSESQSFQYYQNKVTSHQLHFLLLLFPSSIAIALTEA